jgi:hypothetical protein
MVYGLLCALGIRGGLTLGLIGAELLTSYWNHRNSRNASSTPSKVHFLNRRLHHGEIGTVLALSSLLLRATSIPSAAAAIVAGMGMGLIKDDHADIDEWFRFKKKIDKRNYTKVKTTSYKYQKDLPVTEYPMTECNQYEQYEQYEHEPKSESKFDIFDILSYPDKVDKKMMEKFILDSLQKQVRNLVDAQSRTMKQIELQIQKSRNQLQMKKQ